ncbi:MAG: nucleotide-binding protein [Pyrinomonadaceae bacterium]|nr:nucleotide-binding protein [Pyrinomonadaceae bacterium]
MSTNAQEPNLIERLRRLLTVSEQLLIELPFRKTNIRRFSVRAKDCLTKIYGADSELIKEFNRVADAAILAPDPKVGFHRIVLLVERILSSLSNDVIARARDFEKASGAGELRRMFVGHGQSPIWSRVVTHLKDDLGLDDVQAFETASRTSEHIVDILNGFLDTCDAAVVVMTADDRTAEGSGRARQNVIHEIGLFQGRRGFNRVILLQQTGTEDFSNIAGLQTARFNERVEEAFYDLDRAVRKLQGQ